MTQQTPYPSLLTIGIVAGEVSGDALGADLMHKLRAIHPQVRFVGVGGVLMTKAGLDSVLDIKRLSVMGLVEVVKHLPDLLKAKREILKVFEAQRIDIFVGIDAPDFNLRLGKTLKAQGVYSVQYVSPSIWAWRESRIHNIKAATDLVLCLFPFELAVYAKHNHPAVCVGHPLFAKLTPIGFDDRPKLASYLADTINSQSTKTPIRANDLLIKTVFCLMPGSRTSEISAILPVMLAGIAHWYQNTHHHHAATHDQHDAFIGIIPVVSDEHRTLVEGLIAKHATALVDQLKVVSTSTRHFMPSTLVPSSQAASELSLSQSVMAFSDLTVLASGTATLEAMLVGSPMVVLYKVNALTFAIAKRLVKLSHVALPNILALDQLGSPIVPEFIQDDVHAEAIATAMTEVLVSQQHDALIALSHRLKQEHTSPAQAVLDGYRNQLLS